MKEPTPHHTHRRRLLELFEQGQKGLIYLRGGELTYRYGTDYEYPFRQESNFWYLSGVPEPDYALILELSTGTFHLFPPDRDAKWAVWHGRVRTHDEIRDLYRPDELHTGTDPERWISDYRPDVVYCLDEDQADDLESLEESVTIDTEALAEALNWARCIKTGQELEWLRQAAEVNNLAHRKLMQEIRPGLREYECKAIFEYEQVRRGLVFDAYNGIHASGPNSAILHYTGLDRRLHSGDLYLIDAGHEYMGYASDVSRTWPVSGRYTPVQRELYNIVLEAQKKAIAEAGPEVRMETLHLSAARTILEGLTDLGWIRVGADEGMEKNLFTLFFPHGLGHFLGLDTHDVGGHPKGTETIDRPGLQNLRVRRTLEPGMVITVEPGLYLIPALLEPAFSNPETAPCLNRDAIAPHLGMGGIRIEDNLIITGSGCENLTDVPKEVDEIESVMDRAAND